MSISIIIYATEIDVKLFSSFLAMHSIAYFQPAIQCGKLVNLSHQYCVCSNAEEIMGTVSPQPTGAACTYNEDCTGSCIQLQCAPLASLGAACDAADDADCALIDGEIVSCPTDGLCGSFGASWCVSVVWSMQNLQAICVSWYLYYNG